MTEEAINGCSRTLEQDGDDGHLWRYHVSWSRDESVEGGIKYDVVKQDLGPAPPPPPPPSPEELKARAGLRERMNAFLAGLEELTRKHGLAVGNSCGIYEPEPGEGHYTVHEGYLEANMVGNVWAGLDVTWNEGELDGERVEVRDDDGGDA